MPTYTPPLRDMRFVLHELLDVTSHLRLMPAYADIDAATITPSAAPGPRPAADCIKR